MQNQLRASAPVNNGYSANLTSGSTTMNMAQQMAPESSGHVMNTGLVHPQPTHSRNTGQRFVTPKDLTELPLKMVVNAKYVGAIIGQNGSIIREISQDTKAKCIVEPAILAKMPRDSTIQAEKIVNIAGTQENCSKACARILEIAQRELIKDNPNAQNDAIELKLRVPRQLIGRLIGKGGSNIKKFMDETQALISVSDNQADANQMYMPAELFQNEQTIVIKGGTIDVVTAAEKRISQKMRQDYESDINRGIMQQGLMGYAPMMNALPQGVPADPNAMMYANVAFPRFAAPMQFQVMPQNSQPATTLEKVKLFVPSNVVGALIGAKGHFIRTMMRMTGANVRIEEDEEISVESPSTGGKESDQEASLAGDNEPKIPEGEADSTIKAENENHVHEATSEIPPTEPEKKQYQHRDNHHDSKSERTVSISGNDHQIYRAMFWIFQRIAETQLNFMDEVFLSSEVTVPTAIIGRVIGKSGQNVRELQRITQACVKIPPDANQENKHESLIHVHGNFFSTHAVQARLTQLILEYQSKSASADPEPEIIHGSVEPINNDGAMNNPTDGSSDAYDVSVEPQTEPTDN